MIRRIEHIESVNGKLNLPGDKSISHRAVMFASMAEGRSEIDNCLFSADVESTINCFRAMGAKINRAEEKVVVEGCGFNGFTKPETELDAGNSGTTSRLISGVLAVQNFRSCLTGDESLSKRPMMRVVNPLNMMGADVKASANGTLPLEFKPVEKLHPISYELPVASAQLKSAVLLAGLHLDEPTTVIETKPSRNHTETFLNLRVEEEEGRRKIFASNKDYPKSFNMVVPSDISSAAFFIVLALLADNSELLIENVLLNKTRVGILTVLKMMGGNISIQNEKENCGEKSGDLIIKSSNLKNITIPSDIIPNIIDEIPILAIAGLFADGSFEIRNAEELRHKESDRIKAVCENMIKAGVKVEEFDDGFTLEGKAEYDDAVFNSYGDHRIAMAFSVLSVLNSAGGSIEDFDCVKISNPDFIPQLNSITS